MRKLSKAEMCDLRFVIGGSLIRYPS